MAKIIVVVEVKDTTAQEVFQAASAVEDMPMDDPISGWDILGMMWGGDLENLTAKVLVDEITN